MPAVLLLLAMMVSTTVPKTSNPQSTSAMSTKPLSTRNPIIEAQVTHNRIFGAYVLILGLTVFGTYFVWSSGNRVQDAVQADANARIAVASSIAARANASAAGASVEVAKANATASLAHQRAEEAGSIAEQSRLDKVTIEHDNLVLRTQLEQERQSRIAIEKQLAPRRLAPDQVDNLTALLKPLRGQDYDIFIYPNDPEIQTFANSIAFAFKTWDGWKAHPFESPVGLTRGVYIEYDPTDKDAEARGTAIMNFFRDAGIYVSGPFGVLPYSLDKIRKGISFDPPPTSTLRITIGHK